MQPPHVGLTRRDRSTASASISPSCKKVPGKGPAGARRPPYLQNNQPQIGVQREYRGVDGDRRPGVVVEGSAAGVSVLFLAHVGATSVQCRQLAQICAKYAHREDDEDDFLQRSC